MVVMIAMMMMKYRHRERFVTLSKTEVVPMTKAWKFVREVMVVVLVVLEIIIMIMMMMKYSPAYRKVCDAQDDRGCTNDKSLEADEGGNGDNDGDNDDDDGEIPLYGGDGDGGNDSDDYMMKYSPA